MHVNHLDFKQAKDWLSGRRSSSATRSVTKSATIDRAKVPSSPKKRQSTLSHDSASKLVIVARARLWRPEGRTELAYLKSRGLNENTIRRYAVGSSRGITGMPESPDLFVSQGVVIPWVESNRLTSLKIRRTDPGVPRYFELFRFHPTIYPHPRAIQPGKPAIVCEGELDALLLAQELGDLASIATLGSAGVRLTPEVVALFDASTVIFTAHDIGTGGDGAAAQWPERAVRAKPPKGKDWTKAYEAGVNLREWWQAVLSRL
jgi:DNA primase